MTKLNLADLERHHPNHVNREIDADVATYVLNYGNGAIAATPDKFDGLGHAITAHRIARGVLDGPAEQCRAYVSASLQRLKKAGTVSVNRRGNTWLWSHWKVEVALSDRAAIAHRAWLDAQGGVAEIRKNMVAHVVGMRVADLLAMYRGIQDS